MILRLWAAVGVLPPRWLAQVLEALLLVLIAAGATAVALCREPTRQVILLSGYGVVLSVGFFVLQAPDVTLSELTVGAVVLPLIFLIGLAKMKASESGR